MSTLKDKYRKELDRIQRSEGNLTAEKVIERARDPKNPLHDYFDWDVERSAMAHWKAEARRLISFYVTVKVTNYNVSINVRDLVHDPDINNKDGGGYFVASEAKEDPGKAKRCVLERVRSIASQVENIRNLAEWWDLPDAVDLLAQAHKPLLALIEAYKNADDGAPAPVIRPRRRRARVVESRPGA